MKTITIVETPDNGDRELHRAKHFRQARYISDNFEYIIDNIRENLHRLCSAEGIAELHDYGHVAEFKFANFVKADPNSPAIWYRIAVNTGLTD